MTRLVCESSCAGHERGGHDVFSGLWACPACGGLLDPVVDAVDADAGAWRARLDQRAMSVAPIDRSGVWAFREWVLPEVGTDVVTAGEGRGALLAVGDETGNRVALKDCGQNPSGSFKDLGMTVLVSAARAARRPGAGPRALLCASTGDTSAALALYGARANIPVVVLLPRGKVSPAQLVQPLAHGARVVAVDGSFDDCMVRVRELVDEDAAHQSKTPLWLANSKNPLRLLGQMTVALELCRDRGWRAPDVVVVPSGNLGNVFALWRGFQLLKDAGLIDGLPRLVAAQSTAAAGLVAALAGAGPVVVGETHASAIRIGAPVSLSRARRALSATGGLAFAVDETALLQAMAQADRRGHFVCPQTAVALAVTTDARFLDAVGTGLDVVVVQTASGLKFAEQKAAFHGGSTVLGPLSLPPSVQALRNPVVECGGSLSDVRSAVRDAVESAVVS